MAMSPLTQVRHGSRSIPLPYGYRISLGYPGAVQDIYKEHKYTATPEAAVCAALAQGSCDIDSGSVYWKYAASAVTNGTCKEEVLNAALRHTLKLRFELGLFDPIEDQPYWHVPADVIGSEASQQLSLEASQQVSVASLPLASGIVVQPFPLMLCSVHCAAKE